MNKKVVIAVVAMLIPVMIFTVVFLLFRDEPLDEETRLLISLRDVNGITVYEGTRYHVYNGGAQKTTSPVSAMEVMSPAVSPRSLYVSANVTSKKDYAYKADNYTLYDVRDVPWNTKTYMRYQYLGYQSWNRQGHLTRQSSAYTGKYGIRMIDGRCMIALGSRFSTTIGTYIDVILEDGTVIPCILGDGKSDMHTDETHTYQKWDHSVVEFVIDSECADYSDYKAKYPSVQGNLSNIPELSSKVAYIKVYNKVYNIDMNDIGGDHNG